MEICQTRRRICSPFPRFGDDAIDMQELLKRLAEQLVNAVMDAEIYRIYGEGANSRDGYCERGPVTCIDTVTGHIPKLRTGDFIPSSAIER